MFKRSHYPIRVRFLRSPDLGAPPLWQQVWAPRPLQAAHEEEHAALYARIIDDPGSVEPLELAPLNHLEGWRVPMFYYFAKPNDGKFGYGCDLLNLSHPSSRAVLWAIAVVLSRIPDERIIASALVGQAQDVLQRVIDSQSYSKPRDRRADLQALFDLAVRIHRGEPPVQFDVPGDDEFVDGSIMLGAHYYDNHPANRLMNTGIVGVGHVLT